MNGFHVGGDACFRPTCVLTHLPKAPVAEPDCPRCKKGALVEMTGYPDRYARCAVYMVCEVCFYEREVSSDGIL